MKTKQRTKLSQFGCMAVYGKQYANDSYVVVNTRTEKCLEEFKRKADAVEWAKSNSNG